MAFFLEAAFEDGDSALITAALGEVARARGMTRTAKDSGIAREALYRALSAEGRPEFNTILKVLHTFGLRLTTVPIKKAGPKSRVAAKKRRAA
jgi:probable addiction module antidote protein